MEEVEMPKWKSSKMRAGMNLAPVDDAAKAIYESRQEAAYSAQKFTTLVARMEKEVADTLEAYEAAKFGLENAKKAQIQDAEVAKKPTSGVVVENKNEGE
jgi:hypothetical protein